MSFKQKTGEKFRKLRVEKGLTQEFVARKTGISRPSYISVEKGTKDLKLKEAKNLAELFEIDLNDI